MARDITPAAEALLNQELPVLDQGFVRLVDCLGSDARIVQSARVSYGAGTKTVQEDEALIDFLMRHRHTSPFEQVELVFHVRCPIFIARQWFRHRTASVNEVSARYSVMEDRFFSPEPEALRTQGQQNKQVGEGALPPEAAQEAAALFAKANQEAYASYERLLALGVCREQARSVLPVGIYTEFYWKQNLHNLFHFLALRLDGHAQAEIRAYGAAIARCCQAVAPAAYAAFERHLLHAIRLSALEQAAVAELLSGKPHGLTGRQAREFEAKWARLQGTEPSA